MGNFVFSQNFKITDRCWFLHGPFGSLGSSFVLLNIWRDLFGIFPNIFLDFIFFMIQYIGERNVIIIFLNVKVLLIPINPHLQLGLGCADLLR